MKRRSASSGTLRSTSVAAKGLGRAGLLVMLWGAPTWGQDGGSQAEEVDDSTLERVQALLEQAKADPRISESERGEQLELLQQARRSLQNAAEYRARTETFKLAIENGAQQLDQLRAERKKLQKKRSGTVEVPEETRQLREAVDSLRAELTLARNDQAQVVKDLDDLNRSLEQAVDRMPEAETELAGWRPLRRPSRSG